MKKTVILLLINMIMWSQPIFSQIGVNTKHPEQLFHIDPAQNNDTDLTNNDLKLDDIVFTKDGNLGIGTAMPDKEKKLHVVGNIKVSNNTIPKDTLVIEGYGSTARIGVGTLNPETDLHIENSNNNINFKISDSSENLGYILTADQEGRAYWDGLRPMSSIIFGSLKANVDIPGDEKPHTITEDTLSLAPGRWLILAKSAVAGQNLSGYNMYMDLMVENGLNGIYQAGAESITLATAASISEARSGSAYAAAPNIVYVVSVAAKQDPSILPGTEAYNTKFWIALRSSRASKTNSNYGEMQFYAIRIDRPE